MSLPTPEENQFAMGKAFSSSLRCAGVLIPLAINIRAMSPSANRGRGGVTSRSDIVVPAQIKKEQLM